MFGGVGEIAIGGAAYACAPRVMRAAAAFGGGVLAHRAWEDLRDNLPKVQRVETPSDRFRITVRVIAASIPGLKSPGLVRQQRPCLRVCIGSVEKVTEYGDFVPNDDGLCADECPWRFNDKLTFKVDREDVTGPGISLKLDVQENISLGPLQLEMSPGDLAAGHVSLQHVAIPACSQDRLSSTWSSPPVLVPMSRVPGASYTACAELGEAVAHVLLAFSSDVNPEQILESAAGSSMHSIEENLREASRRVGKRAADMAYWLTPRDICSGHTKRQQDHSSRNLDILSPERTPDDWICHRVNGRVQWHHPSLGQPPWERVDIYDFVPDAKADMQLTREQSCDTSTTAGSVVEL